MNKEVSAKLVLKFWKFSLTEAVLITNFKPSLHDLISLMTKYLF